MNNALKEGDNIFINKLAYGARLPITPLSFHFGNHKFFIDWIQFSYYRLPGYAEVKRDDIIVFNLPSDNLFPTDEKKEYVKRCIAKAGDIVLIKQGDVFINGAYKSEPKVLKWYYLNANELDTICSKRYLFNEGNNYVSSDDVDTIMKCRGIISCKKKYLTKENFTSGYFPNCPQIKWNPDNFGPYYVPRKGQSIYLNKNNLLLYQTVIEKYEDNSVKYKGDSVFINGVYSKLYTFKMDYYFVLGDNRYNSIDSRYWGVVPENHLIGKMEWVLF